MLTNLLKYEFKASGRVVLPIASGVLVLNIFTGILSHFIQNTSDRFPLAGLALVLLNLAALVSLHLPKAQVIAALQAANLDERARPEQLTLEDYCALQTAMMQE